MKECMARAGRRLFVEEYAQAFRTVGLVNVTERIFVWPVSPWPQGIRNEYARELGRWTRKTLLDGLEGLSMALMTRYGGMSKDEVVRLVENVKADLWNTRYHVYVQM